MHFIKKKKNQEIKLIITCIVNMYSVSCAKFQFDVNKSGMCVCVCVCVRVCVFKVFVFVYITEKQWKELLKCTLLHQLIVVIHQTLNSWTFYFINIFDEILLRSSYFRSS